MSTSCSNTRSKSLSKWQDCKWTPVANHSISIATQSSARQCWSLLACISDIVPASRPTHDNPIDWELAKSVAIRFFQWNQGISSWSCSLAQELLCEQVRHLAERRCPTGDACSLWLDLAWWRSNWRSLWPFRPQVEVVYKTWISARLLFMWESQFNYLFTLKNAHLSSNSYDFWMQPNIAMKLAGYVAWILFCKTIHLAKKVSTIPEISNFS